jgi:hypothetical protein
MPSKSLRDFFDPWNGQIGQSETDQIDCLEDLARELGSSNSRLWQMRNGYALATHSGLVEISNRLRASNEDEIDELRHLLRIGMQWNTQVTLKVLLRWSPRPIAPPYLLLIPNTPLISGQSLPDWC